MSLEDCDLPEVRAYLRGYRWGKVSGHLLISAKLADAALAALWERYQVTLAALDGSNAQFKRMRSMWENAEAERDELGKGISEDLTAVYMKGYQDGHDKAELECKKCEEGWG